MSNRPAIVRSIPQIDRDIDANRKELYRRQKISARCVDTAVYQAAYDAEPELKHILDALWLERGWAQKDRDEKAYKAAMSQRVRNPRAKRCPTCKRAA